MAKRKREEDSNDDLEHPPVRLSAQDIRIEYWRQNNYHWPVDGGRLAPLGGMSSPTFPSGVDYLEIAKDLSSCCVDFLASNHLYMFEHREGVVEESLATFHRLFTFYFPLPTGTIFDDHAFERTCMRLATINAAALTRQIADLLVPSAEAAVDLGYPAFEHLTVSIGETWTHCISFNTFQPQPDFAVGFARDAFTMEQYQKLEQLIGGYDDKSYFRGSASMYFPFLVCEVRGADETLDIAEQQNTHNAALCVRSVVELFKLVQRQHEIDRVILAISILHDNSLVQIHGHYAEIGHDYTSYFRTTLAEFYFTSPDGTEKWTCYRFVMALYADWAPAHFRWLASAIDDLPLPESTSSSLFTVQH